MLARAAERPMVATKDIAPGEEIFIRYGKSRAHGVAVAAGERARRRDELRSLAAGDAWCHRRRHRPVGGRREEEAPERSAAAEHDPHAARISRQGRARDCRRIMARRFNRPLRVLSTPSGPRKILTRRKVTDSRRTVAHSATMDPIRTQAFPEAQRTASGRRQRYSASRYGADEAGQRGNILNRERRDQRPMTLRRDQTQ